MAQARMAQARMAQAGLGSDLAGSQTLSTLLTTHLERSRARQTLVSTIEPLRTPYRDSHFVSQGMDSTGKGILIGMLSAFGSAILIASILAAIYFFRYTNRGRILLDRMGRPGEYDDEQAFAKEEADALAEMDDIQCAEYLRAKGKALIPIQLSVTDDTSLYTSKSPGICADRYIVVSVSGHTRERSVGLEIRAGAGNRKLLRRSTD